MGLAQGGGRLSVLEWMASAAHPSAAPCTPSKHMHPPNKRHRVSSLRPINLSSSPRVSWADKKLIKPSAASFITGSVIFRSFSSPLFTGTRFSDVREKLVLTNKLSLALLSYWYKVINWLHLSVLMVKDDSVLYSEHSIQSHLHEHTHISLCGLSILSLLCLELHLFAQLYSVPPPVSEEELHRDLTNPPAPSWAAVPLHWVRQQSDKLALFSVTLWTPHTPLPGKNPNRFLESTGACSQVTLEQEMYFS